MVEFEWTELSGDADCERVLGVGQLANVRLPVVELPDGERLFGPSLKEVASRLGFVANPRLREYDVSIYGAGPAGLSAAVYAASEGLRTVLVERSAVGGQAGTTSLIENYMGFPQGINGADLAERARQQAVKFGVEILMMREGMKSEFHDTRLIRGRGCAGAFDQACGDSGRRGSDGDRVRPSVSGRDRVKDGSGHDGAGKERYGREMMPEGQPDEAQRADLPSRAILSLIGDKWTVVVLYCLSRQDIRRFNELQRQIPEISRKMLSQTLRGLERDGLVERTVYPEVPPRTDYRLTDDGHRLREPIVQLCQWAVDNMDFLETVAARRAG